MLKASVRTISINVPLKTLSNAPKSHSPALDALHDTNIQVGCRTIVTRTHQAVHIPVRAPSPTMTPSQIRDQPVYQAGKPFKVLPLKPLFEGLFRRGIYRNYVDASFTELPPHRRLHKNPDSTGVFRFGIEYDPAIDRDTLYYRLLHVIATTQTVRDAWTAYSSLLERGRPSDLPNGALKFPLEHLHRLCRLLSRSTPKTRQQFLRLMSVMHMIQRTGGRVQLFEWNALIDNAGKGWRGTRPTDFKLALDVFSDMLNARPPGNSYSLSDFPPTRAQPRPLSPDIYTYTSLIKIASSTLYPASVAYAHSLLEQSNFEPNRITHLSLLKFFGETKQMFGVRTILRRMRQGGIDVGIDGTNLLLWVYSTNNQLDVAQKLYRVLRHNVTANDEKADIHNIVDELREEQGIPLYHPVLLKPNEITYNSMIQIFGYHGQFKPMIDVFIDMLSTENWEQGAPLQEDTNDGELKPTRYQPNMVIFRAIFLAFSRHGIYVGSGDLTSRLSQSWTFDNLQAIYGTFMGLTHTAKPSRSTLYWIMVSFDRTSGHDLAILRKVWTELEKKFRGPWGGHGNRLRFLGKKLFAPDDEARAYFSQHGFRSTYERSKPVYAR